MRTLRNFIKENESFFKEPIVESFFKNEENYYLLQKFIEDTDEEAKKQLNELFSLFFMKFRLVNYITTLSRNYSIHFDKMVRKQAKYNLLILNDVFTVNENKTLYVDSLPSKSPSLFNQVSEEKQELSEVFENEKIYKIISKLSPKEQLILELHFVQNFSIKEISVKLENSPQNISKSKNKALSTIKKKLNEQLEE